MIAEYGINLRNHSVFFPVVSAAKGQLPFKGGVPDCRFVSEIRRWACWYKLSRNYGMLCLKAERHCQSPCWQCLASVQGRGSQLPLHLGHHDSQELGSRGFHRCLFRYATALGPVPAPTCHSKSACMEPLRPCGGSLLTPATKHAFPTLLLILVTFWLESPIVNVGMTVWQATPVLCMKSYP